MAYSGGIFYIDLVSGSDASRAALTSCVASNPSGSITRINKTAHGLVTGAVVDLTLFTAWLNGAWKITVVDANNFDLDTAVWQTTGDPNGTVTPRGGTHADPWLTIATGASSSRINAGDTIRVKKTGSEISSGVNGTFTNGSNVVTLASALTKTIENAIGNTWTVSANITGGTNTTRKIGATAQTFTPAAGFTTGKVAYKALGSAQDFSAYSKISFWFRPTATATIAANTYKICLCSDTVGNTIVNEVNIPATINTASFSFFTVNYGAALGSSIQSVAIYANTDPATTIMSIQNIFACNDFSLESTFGKAGDVNYCPQAIDGTTVYIDSNNTSATSRGYYGTTEAVPFYYQNHFNTPMSTSTWQTVSKAGDFTGGFITLSGGWDLSTQTQDGVTGISSRLVGVGTAIALNNYWTLENMKLMRHSLGVSPNWHTNLLSLVVAGGGSGISSNVFSGDIYNCKFMNGSAQFSVTGEEITIRDCQFLNMGGTAANASYGLTYIDCLFANNTTGSLAQGATMLNGTGSARLRNCNFLDTTEFTTNANFRGLTWSYNHDDTPGNHWGFTNGATVNWQTSVVHDTEPGAWKVSINSTARTIIRAVPMEIGQFAVSAGALATVSAWVKKDNATTVGAKLYVMDGAYNVAGVVAASDTKANDTAWEQLTITFTPTVNGVVSVYLDSWYVSGFSNIYLGSTSLTQ